MAAILSLPIWGAALQQAKRSEAEAMASAYHADLARYKKSQKPKHVPMIRHDSMFDDEEDEPELVPEPVEETAVEEIPMDESEHKSFTYELPTGTSTWRERQLFSLRWPTVQKQEPSLTFAYNELSEEPSFRERQLFALSFWPVAKNEPSQTFKYDLPVEAPSFRQRQLFSLRLW